MPAAANTPSFEVLKARYDAAGQGHVLNFYGSLEPERQQALLQQLAGLDVDRVNRIYKHAVAAEAALNGSPAAAAPDASSSSSTGAAAADELEPLPPSVAASVLASPEKTAEWRATGLAAIAKSQVCVLLMAGGQGTRLGSSSPKGCFDILLPSHKSLFQYQAERIRRLKHLAAAQAGAGARPTITWFVMTSGPTRRETEAFFHDHAFFGLERDNVIFFEQGTLPCLSDDGKIFLASPSELAVAPDGNGGLYSALLAPVSPSDPRSVLSIMRERQIEYVHCYGVDNCLVRVADPAFIGYNIALGAECGAKVVPKTEPTESVGVVARKGGAYGVVEYTELPPAKAALRHAATGALAFRAANIANHFYTTAFLGQVESFEPLMAFHIARKKIPTVDLASGAPVKPATPNGMKLELFVFDVFPFTQQFAVLEVERAEEFSPLKNGPGTTTDNQQTSRADLLAQQRRWVERAGATVEGGAVGELEVGPLVSYAGEGLEALAGVVFTKGGVLEGLTAEHLARFQ